MREVRWTCDNCGKQELSERRPAGWSVTVQDEAAWSHCGAPCLAEWAFKVGQGIALEQRVELTEVNTVKVTVEGTDEEIGRACWEHRRRIDALLNDGAPCGPYPPWEEIGEPARESWRKLAPKIRRGELTIEAAAGGAT